MLREPHFPLPSNGDQVSLLTLAWGRSLYLHSGREHTLPPSSSPLPSRTACHRLFSIPISVRGSLMIPGAWC